MQFLNDSIQSFLSHLETKLHCDIQFVSVREKPVAFLTKDSLFYEDGKIGFPLFFKEELYGCFFISGHHLSKKSFKLLEILIKDGLNYYLENFGDYFYFQHVLPQPEDHLEDENILPFSRVRDGVGEDFLKEPNLLFVSGESKEEILQSALKIHNLTHHVAFIHLDLFMKKGGSFKNWSHFSFTTLFLPDWMGCKDWQKEQIKNFISSSKPPLPLKIVIGLKGEDVEWKIS